MPIVYVHGVAVRNPDERREEVKRAGRAFREVPWPQIEALLRQHVAPAIASDPEGVPVLRAYWGDLGADFAWNGLSYVSTPSLDAPRPVRLAELEPDALGGVLERAVLKDTLTVEVWPNAVAAVWAVARDERVRARLAACATAEAETALLRREVEAAYLSQSGAVRDARRTRWLATFSRQLRAWRQARATRALTALRRPFEAFATVFLGDVLTYLRSRGDATAPGPIPLRVLGTLAEARRRGRARPGEPLVVVSHSMGGQIVYDLVTHFLPGMPEHADLRIDFWAAVASQVGLFEELKLFLASRPEYGSAHGNTVPRPDPRFLGRWWNIWDHADFLSFRAEGIFAGVDDTAFFAGGSLRSDHSAYLGHPDLYRTVAAKVRSSRA